VGGDGAGVGYSFFSEEPAKACGSGIYSVVAGFTLFFFWLAIAAVYFGVAEALAVAGFGKESGVESD